MGRLYIRGSLEDRFWPRVQKTDTCWLWTGTCTHGYGQIHGGQERPRNLKAHRVAYELLVGPVPDGLDLDHLCRNRACVNPAHLEPVTRQENIRRGVGVGKWQTRKTHCPQGHPYDEANTYFTLREGWRQCRACMAARARARKERQRCG